MGPRSMTHGTCALSGLHRRGSLYAQECPILRRLARDHGALQEALQAPHAHWVPHPVTGPSEPTPGRLQGNPGGSSRPISGAVDTPGANLEARRRATRLRVARWRAVRRTANTPAG